MSELFTFGKTPGAGSADEAQRAAALGAIPAKYYQLESNDLIEDGDMAWTPEDQSFQAIFPYKEARTNASGGKWRAGNFIMVIRRFDKSQPRAFTIEVFDIAAGQLPEPGEMVYVFDDIDETWNRAEIVLTNYPGPHFLQCLQWLEPNRYHRWTRLPILK